MSTTRDTILLGALLLTSAIVRRGCTDEERNTTPHANRPAAGVQSPPVARHPILCAERPAWMNDFATGMNPTADGTLWTRTHGHFSDWVFQPGLLGAPPSLGLTAGGGSAPVELSGLGMRDADTGASCAASYVARQPDVQVVVPQPGLFMRLYAVPSGASNPTLAVRMPDGRWRCNDDHGRSEWGNGAAAVLDFCLAREGLYTVWVGSNDASHHNPTTLYLTGNPDHHP